MSVSSFFSLSGFLYRLILGTLMKHASLDDTMRANWTVLIELCAEFALITTRAPVSRFCAIAKISFSDDKIRRATSEEHTSDRESLSIKICYARRYDQILIRHLCVIRDVFLEVDDVVSSVKFGYNLFASHRGVP